MKAYTPYGDDWRREVKQMTLVELQSCFKVKREKNESKDDLVERIRIKCIVRDFNDKYPIGKQIHWSPSPSCKPVQLTVTVPAFACRGRAVAFFLERSGYLCVEPEFINLPNT